MTPDQLLHLVSGIAIGLGLGAVLTDYIKRK